MIWLLVIFPLALLFFIAAIIERNGKKKRNEFNMNHHNQHITEEGNAVREAALQNAKNNNNHV
ncbi:hypothetical protein [Fictibacillus sp. NRS-1165]|uniref:hypothetical protein n=1 Tax=Fictibacillus sp. NRS-1165 TaxID=3144463 RepID=UPI003D191038